MAKSKPKTRTVYRAAKKTYSRRTNGTKKGYGGLISGAIAGAGGTLLKRFIPSMANYSQPAADIAIGAYMKNDTLTTIGGRTLGAMLAGMATGTGTGTTASSTTMFAISG